MNQDEFEIAIAPYTTKVLDQHGRPFFEIVRKPRTETIIIGNNKVVFDNGAKPKASNIDYSTRQVRKPRPVKTPLGIFPSVIDAAEAHNVSAASIYGRLLKAQKLGAVDYKYL